MSSDKNDGVREFHPSDSPIPNSTLQIRLGEPLPDAERGFKKNGETRTRKTGCKFKIQALSIASGKWRGSIVEGKEFHNHEASDGPVKYSANRTKALYENPEAKRYLVSQLSRNSSVSTIRAELLNKWQIEVTQRDMYNISQSL
ncbi:hypothetical protein GcM1_230018 [Golovinomyces cichoracearum]|uniref:FAR1 domain-containing protein n=1 Tax=Golovinomyces cichoracearum TaxID=62708 RepID=A0A420IN11_9PEZI|nr:hypothetical protein GcM1_230018 [Golovinomyces cichoracearum]